MNYLGMGLVIVTWFTVSWMFYKLLNETLDRLNKANEKIRKKDKRIMKLEKVKQGYDKINDYILNNFERNDQLCVPLFLLPKRVKAKIKSKLKEEGSDEQA